jgi:Zinc knuckle
MNTTVPEIEKFSGTNKDDCPAFCVRMETIFLYDQTSAVARGVRPEPAPARPFQVGLDLNGLNQFNNDMMDWRPLDLAWRKKHEKMEEQSSISRSKLHARCGPMVLSSLSILLNTHNHPPPNQHRLISMQDRLFAEWTHIKDNFLPDIADYAAVAFRKLDLSTDEGGVRQHIDVFQSQIIYIDVLTRNAPAPEPLFRVVAGANVAVPVVNPYMPTDHQLKQMFLKGITHEQLQPLKLALSMDDVITFTQCIAKMLKANDKILAALKVDKFSNMRTDTHPFKAGLEYSHLTVADHQKRQAKLAKFESDFDDISYSRANVTTSQSEAYTSRGRDYGRDDRRDDSRRDDSRRRDDGSTPQYGVTQCYNCGSPNHKAVDCPELRCNTCFRTWNSKNDPGRHTSYNCPDRNVRGRSGSRDRNSRDRSRDRSAGYNTFNNRGRSNSPRQSANTSSSSQRPGTPRADNNDN